MPADLPTLQRSPMPRQRLSSMRDYGTGQGLAGNHPPITVSTPTADVAVLLVHVGCRRGRYPIGSWSEHAEGRLCPGQASEDRRIMATCREQYKTMPDRVVKAQALPDMKERAERVENASDREKP